jgi:hypothetical protein
MYAKGVLKILRELGRIHRYWHPDEETKKFLEDIDWSIRMDKADGISIDAARKLRAIYDEAKGELK